MGNKFERKYTKEEFKDIIYECIDWLKPNMVDIKDKDGKVTGQKDLHKENVFTNEFFLSKGISRMYKTDMITQYPWLQEDLDILLEVQEFKIARYGLFKKTSEKLTQFVLINNHGNHWEDRKVKDNTHKVKDFNIKDLIKFKDE